MLSITTGWPESGLNSYVLPMTYTTDYIQVHVLKMNFWLVCITVEFYPLQK